MSNRGAIIRFCASVIVVALFLTYSSIKGLNYIPNDTITQTMAPIIVTRPELQDSSAAQNASSQSTVTQNNNSSITSSNSTSSITVSASGAVQGTVIEKFISPYTANTSYNNVYLKNNTDLKINLKDFVNGKIGIDI